MCLRVFYCGVFFSYAWAEMTAYHIFLMMTGEFPQRIESDVLEKKCQEK